MIPYAIGKFFQRRRGGAFGQEKVGAGECAAAGEKEPQGRPAGGVQPVWPHGAAADSGAGASVDDVALVQQRFRVVCSGAGHLHRADVFPSLQQRHGRHGEADVDVPAGGDPHSCQHLPLVHGEGRGPPHPEAAGAAADRREPGSAASGPGDRILRHRRSVPLSQPQRLFSPVCQHGDEVLPTGRGQVCGAAGGAAKGGEVHFSGVLHH